VQQGQARINVSVVTESELLIRPIRDNEPEAVERIEDLLSEEGMRVIPVDRRTARVAAEVRARHRLKLADAIIVATALETGCDAIVGNDREWRRVSEVPYVHLDEVVAS
jgi:predicted nucleic acid-binding protein